jgi:hypothetical protein
MKALIILIAAIASTLAGGPATTATVSVTGGPNAGTYHLDARASCEFADEKPPAPKHSFYIMLGAPNADGRTIKDPKVMTVMYLRVPDADRRTPVSQFWTAFVFGDPSHGTRYGVETRPGEKDPAGSGSVTIVQHGEAATVSFDAKTAAGIEFKGAIQCTDVLRD